MIPDLAPLALEGFARFSTFSVATILSADSAHRGYEVSVERRARVLHPFIMPLPLSIGGRNIDEASQRNGPCTQS